MIVRRRAAHDGLNRWCHRLRFANSGKSAVGVNDQDAVIIGAIEQLNQRIFGAQVDGLYSSDLHGKIPLVGPMIMPRSLSQEGQTVIAKE